MYMHELKSNDRRWWSGGFIPHIVESVTVTYNFIIIIFYLYIITAIVFLIKQWIQVIVFYILIFKYNSYLVSLISVLEPKHKHTQVLMCMYTRTHTRIL